MFVWGAATRIYLAAGATDLRAYLLDVLPRPAEPALDGSPDSRRPPGPSSAAGQN